MKYIALTIGPIYKTLSIAKKPKELWSGSYFFSYIMREIISKFKEREFITPYIKDKTIFKDNEIGLFHDRFIFESQEGDLENLEKTIQNILNETAKKLKISYDDLREYLQIHYIQKEIDEDKNPIIEFSKYLDTQELFFQVSQSSDEVLKAIANKKSFLLEGKTIIDDLKEIASNNYFAIVHADGDNMSKAIQDKNKIENVSKNLFEYCINSHQKIQDFGGQTIFAGGDDLLFFAPIIGKDNKTIFELCEDISKDFEERLNKIATLSFGVSIQYLKYPLYEALEESRNQLFGKAKNFYIDKKQFKNNVAFRVTKHSGQTFETLIHKGDKEVYDKFLSLITSLKDDSEDKFLYSIHHKINIYQNIIENIGNDFTKLQNFFNNYFNEDEHKKYKEFFIALIKYIVSVYQSQTIKKVDKLNTIYSTLRFIKFIKGNKK